MVLEAFSGFGEVGLRQDQAIVSPQ